jgi:hypothetical protein
MRQVLPLDTMQGDMHSFREFVAPYRAGIVSLLHTVIIRFDLFEKSIANSAKSVP